MNPGVIESIGNPPIEDGNLVNFFWMQRMLLCPLFSVFFEKSDNFCHSFFWPDFSESGSMFCDSGVIF